MAHDDPSKDPQQYEEEARDLLNPDVQDDDETIEDLEEAIELGMVEMEVDEG